MGVSLLTSFISPLRDYLTDHPGAVENGAQRTLGSLAERTFENAEEAGLALAEFEKRFRDQTTQS